MIWLFFPHSKRNFFICVTIRGQRYIGGWWQYKPRHTSTVVRIYGIYIYFLYVAIRYIHIPAAAQLAVLLHARLINFTSYDGSFTHINSRPVFKRQRGRKREKKRLNGKLNLLRRRVYCTSPVFLPIRIRTRGKATGCCDAWKTRRAIQRKNSLPSSSPNKKT